MKSRPRYAKELPTSRTLVCDSRVKLPALIENLLVTSKPHP